MNMNKTNERIIVTALEALGVTAKLHKDGGERDD